MNLEDLSVEELAFVVYREVIRWQCMKERCKSYARQKSRRIYYQRGIKVCDEWEHDFMAYWNHVSQLPHFNEQDGIRRTLDRINNDGDYEPGNVRWATDSEQSLNRRTHVDLFGKSFKEWADITGISEALLRDRYKKGDRSPERLFRPKRGTEHKKLCTDQKQSVQSPPSKNDTNTSK